VPHTAFVSPASLSILRLKHPYCAIDCSLIKHDFVISC
jgi:hypothetical protein